MGKYYTFSCCSKSDTDAHDPAAATTGGDPRKIVRIFQRDGFTIPSASFFPGDGSHKLEIKFDGGSDHQGSEKMRVVVDGVPAHEVVLEGSNFQGTAGSRVNGREINIVWDITGSSATLLFKHEGSVTVGIVGRPSSSQNLFS